MSVPEPVALEQDPGAPRLMRNVGLALLLAAAPQMLVVPWWLVLVFVVAGGWRVAAAFGRLPSPSRGMLGLMTLLLCIGVGWHYRTLFGREAGVALLFAMSALKLLEWRTRRDAQVLTLLAYLLVMARLLYDQGLLTAVYAALAVTVTLAAQVSASRADISMSSGQNYRLVGSMLVRAIPVALVLFLCFPRVQGPLWNLPQDAAARTGIDDEMSPGSIARLNLSDAVAFRVRFSAAVPPPAQRYWRGLVLERFDGRVWRAYDPLRRSARFAHEAVGEPIEYVITLEPSGRRWLFALDRPASLPAATFVDTNDVLRRLTPVTELLRYTQYSDLDYRSGPLSSVERLRALALPSDAAPQAVELGRRWQQTLKDPRQRVEAALRLFREGPYRYTLQPPLLTGDVVDEFLFETRAGYCEHYAGAFVVLMRAAAVPARVVAGYLGAERAPSGEYYIVRQSDAHAWAEVWLEGQGWTRVDPTAAIAPERVERGTFAAIGDPSVLPLLARRGDGWLRQALLQLDALDVTWNEWVLAYGPERQRELLQWLGWHGADVLGLLALMLGGLLIVAALLAAWSWWCRRPRHDALAALYLRFCARLEWIGLSRAAHEGPQAFAARIARQRPDLADETGYILDLYASLRFGPAASAEQLRELRLRVRNFRPRA